MLRMTFLLCL